MGLVSNLVAHQPIKYQPADVQSHLCTHIIYSFSVLNSETLNIEAAKEWTDIDNQYYQNVTALKKEGVKVMIALNAMNDVDGDKYGRLLNDDKARHDFIKSVVVFIQKHNFDGLDLNLEVREIVDERVVQMIKFLPLLLLPISPHFTDLVSSLRAR